MRILFLSDNFPPETNAPATRTYEHAREWLRLGHEVTVITCAPNFPRGKVFAGYRNRLFQKQTMDGIEVVRVWTYITANEGFIKRTLDYVSYMWSAFFASFFVGKPDVIIATSPQLFTAVAGWLVAKIKRRPWVFELRDLWPETILAVGAVKRQFVIRRLKGLARFLYRKADLMVPVTHAFKDHLIRCGVEPDRILVITNGIDPLAARVARDSQETRREYHVPQDAFVAAYVGTIGMCHGLSTILDAAELASDVPELHFLIMGDGADRTHFKEVLAARGVKNVTLLDAQKRDEALAVLHASDVALVMLRKSEVFETVIPSKIFEAMVLGRPIVLGVEGESKRIVVDECKAGVAFTPEDAKGLVESFRRLAGDKELCVSLGKNGLAAVRERFDRRVLAERMIAGIASRLDAPGAAPGGLAEHRSG